MLYYGHLFKRKEGNKDKDKKGDTEMKVLEHDAALTTELRKRLYKKVKKTFEHVLPREVGGIFSLYGVNFDRDTGLPTDTALYYAVTNETERLEALRRLKSSFICKGDAPLTAFILIIDGDTIKWSWKVQQMSDGELVAE